MVEIPDSLRCVFSTTVRERDGTYVVDIPSEEIDREAVTPGETYRIAIFEAPATTEHEEQDSQHPDHAQRPHQTHPPEPPVEEGEIRDVTIETVGDQGDGIAKVDRGYVVIVPGTQPSEQPTVKIEQVQQNVAFAGVVDPDHQTL
jgi:predicted RNA-binding protein with TRAM domain